MAQSFSFVGSFLEGYVCSDQEVVDDDTYYGFLRLDGSWYILRQRSTDTASSYRYVRGSIGYTDMWDSKTGLEYQYLNNAAFT